MAAGGLFFSCWVLAGLVLVQSVDRVYYIAAVERVWDYAPGGNLISTDLDEASEVFLKNDTNRIGSRYKKVLYREFTDGTFTTEKPHPPHLGVLGPVLKAEVGDRFVVTFRNLATRNYSMHPHGVQYEKGHEGAFYQDGTSGKDKHDDKVPPGGEHRYLWHVRDEEAPKERDPNCLTWVYHSHMETERDTNSGLMGVIHTCKKGVFSGSGTDLQRTDVDHDYTLLFTLIDENLSWYIDDNIKSLPGSVDKEDEDFKESNKMHGVNGYLYGNLPGLDMCTGDSVSWHLFGIGNEPDLHTAVFHGQTLLHNNHRVDYTQLFPAEFATNLMRAGAPGKWLLECSVADHYEGGMLAYINVTDCRSDVSTPSGATVREYFIAADEVAWNYGPTGRDNFEGHDLLQSDRSSFTFFENGPHRIGGTYKKALYRQYTNENFTTLRHTPEAERHMGFLGPVIRAEVGDAIRVHFLNNASGHNYSMQARGVSYDKENEGTFYMDGRENQYGVAPGQTKIYEWFVTEEYAPASTDPDCLTYIYYSARQYTDIYDGLVGPLLVCRKGSLNANGKQKNVDQEFFLLFTVTDENKSAYLDDNINTYCTDAGNVSKDDEDFQESNKMHNINGYMYANLPGLDACSGQKTSWHILGVGTETDLHAVKFHGNAFSLYNHNKDTTLITPAATATLSMVPDNTGEWALVCRTSDHFDGGMVAKYNVSACGGSSMQVMPQSEKERVYYIAAVEEVWNYAPSDIDPIFGTSLSEPDSRGAIFVVRGNTTIGREYKKVMYRQYTDSTFTQRVARSSRDEHLDVMGPFIKAEVGEEIEVYFKNMATRPYSIHPHMLHYTKSEEGAIYESPGDRDTVGVAPGETREYKWQVPVRSGPGENDPACITAPYYSHVDSIKDTNSGLIGPMVICRQGTLSGDNNIRRDVDVELVLLFMVIDENESHYLDENIQTYCYTPDKIDKDDEDFKESNKMHAINGRIYGNNQGLVMTSGQKVAWYLLGMGNEVDIHTVHFHGQTVTVNHDHTRRVDVVDVFPGTSDVADMVPHTAGNWLVHCHVNDHITAGMETAYTVLSADASRRSELGPGAIAGIAVAGCLFVILTGFLVFKTIQVRGTGTSQITV